jgi:hypothetical protein
LEPLEPFRQDESSCTAARSLARARQADGARAAGAGGSLGRQAAAAGQLLAPELMRGRVHIQGNEAQKREQVGRVRGRPVLL